MRRLLAATIVALWPFASLADTHADGCAQALDQFAAFSGNLLQRSDAPLGASDDGLCSLRGDGPFAFQSGSFRVDQAAGTVAPNRTIDFTLAQVETGLGVLDVSGTIIQDLKSGATRLAGLAAARDDAPVIQAQAELVVLPIGAASRLTDLEATRITLVFNVTPAMLQNLGWDYGEVTRVALDRALKDVNRTQIGNATRSAFLRLAQAAPAARGRLEAELTFGQSANIMQIIGLVAVTSDEALAAALANAYPDATLTLTWSPGRL